MSLEFIKKNINAKNVLKDNKAQNVSTDTLKIRVFA